MNKAPSFFKFFIAEISSIDMKIPVAFTSLLEQALPEKVFLRDRYNNVWRVKVAKVGNYWFFVDDWDKFVEGNFLKSGDLMVFEHFCDSVFNVKVYGPSATEKNVVGPSKLKGHVEKQQQQKSEQNNIFYVDDNEDDESDDSDYIMMRSPENECEEVVPEQVNNDGVGVSGNTRDRLIYPYPKCYGMEIFKAGLAQQPENPYFVTKILPKRKSTLFIPMDVIKDYELSLGNEIILVDPNGKEFQTKCKKWDNGRWALSGEWSLLCKENCVTLEDTCICEFVKREGDQQLFLHISFVRANM